MTGKIPVYEDQYCDTVVGHVTPNTKLDKWDGNNYTDGSTGNHVGYSRLTKSKRFVLIHTTQWQGCKDYGVIISPEELVRLAIENDCLCVLLKDYPELKSVCEDIIESD